MKKVEAYESLDGKLYKTASACHEADNIVRLEEGIKKFVDAHCYSGMRCSDIESVLIDHSKELHELLKEVNSEFTRDGA